MSATNNLGCLFPATWPPAVVRLICDFAGCPSRVCSMLRLSLHGVLHDVYCIYDSPECVVVVAAAGITLRVPQSESGVSSWPADLDTNPRHYHAITVGWLRTILEPRSVGSFQVSYADGSDQASSRTLHRRIRCFRDGEDPSMPSFAPFFVYVRLFAPSLVLRGVEHNAARYMRESVVLTTLVHLCRPSPAPTTYYCCVHEESGSSCAVLDDATAAMVPHEDIVPSIALTKRVLQSLALLHGRFLAPCASLGHVSEAHEEAVAQRDKELRAALVHPMVFFAQWKARLDVSLSTATEDDAARQSAQALAEKTGKARSSFVPQLSSASQEAERFGAFDPTDALQRLYAIAEAPSLVVEAASVKHAQHQQDAAAIGEGGKGTMPPTTTSTTSRHNINVALTATKTSSLTLIHGAISTVNHALFLRDARQLPNCLFVDWKSSGIGPLEVDVVDAMMAFLPQKEAVSKRSVLELLEEYCSCLHVFYSVDRTAEALLATCRDVTRLRCYSQTRSEGFEWGGDKKRDLIAFANTLADLVDAA